MPRSPQRAYNGISIVPTAKIFNCIGCTASKCNVLYLRVEFAMKRTDLSMKDINGFPGNNTHAITVNRE